MLNPANGGASDGVWGRNPSAVKIIVIESDTSTFPLLSLTDDEAHFDDLGAGAQDDRGFQCVSPF
jgi:hypothetical protein